MRKGVFLVISACTTVIGITVVHFFLPSTPAVHRPVASADGVSSTQTERVLSSIPIQADAFLDSGRFERAQSVRPVTLTGRVVAGVVNHHVLASDVLQRFFVSLGQARPEVTRIILISPDHYKRGASPISMGMTNYVTRSHTVQVDRDAIERLRTSGVAFGDRALFEHEHGIGALVPFLANAFPRAAIVPLVIRADIPDEDAWGFGRRLADIVDDATIVIVSSDMSHYLPEKKAVINDEKTMLWLQTRNGASMATATDDFTDNGPAFVMLFSLFEALRIVPSFQLIDHSISTAYGGDRQRTTSYMNGVWAVSNIKTSR